MVLVVGIDKLRKWHEDKTNTCLDNNAKCSCDTTWHVFRDANGKLVLAPELVATVYGSGRTQAERLYDCGFKLYSGIDKNIRDIPRALEFLNQAAEMGLAQAQTRLGTIYEMREEVDGKENDYSRAMFWYKLAAEQNYPEAQFRIGRLYRQGLGVPQDYIIAHFWLNLAAAKNLEYAAYARDDLSKIMSPAQIAEAQRLAREWKPKK
ncbi:MAG: sel1 repeat family protein [Nitrospiraceae bacterium]|nr:sel1 repeat family protein [Nitrospiraceae bacterium]